MTSWQLLNLGLDHLQCLGSRHCFGRAFGAQHSIGRLQMLEQIEISAVICVRFEGRHVLQDSIAHPLSPEPVHRGIRKNALKEQGQFRTWTISVFLCQSDHRVLDDVQCRLVVTDREHGALECPFLGTFEEVGQFFVASQVFSTARHGEIGRKRAGLCHWLLQRRCSRRASIGLMQ